MNKSLLLVFISAYCHAQAPEKLTMVFTGDLMQHQVMINTAFNPELKRYEYIPCFRFIKPALSAPDLTIGNLELTFGGPPYTGYPIFSAPDEFAAALKDTGFDIIVTANNHALDRGKKGLERTIDVLDSVELIHTGTFKDTVDWLNNYPLVVEAKGFRLSLLNYTYGLNGLKVRRPNKVNMIDTAQIRKDLAVAKKQGTDAIIVLMHWGNQYENVANAEQKMVAEFCLKHGASIIVGSHPHVLQHMEWRKEKGQVVAYSLGNFLGNQPERYRGIGVLFNVELEKNYNSGKATVSISDVSYSLTWVYRTLPDEKFVILPVEQFAGDTTFVTNPAARQRLKLLQTDTYSMFGRYNLNVGERKKDK